MCNFVFSVYESMSEEASVCMLHVGVSLYMCAYIYNVYAYTCESVCVLHMLEFLCVCVYIYSVYVCIWESPGMRWYKIITKHQVPACAEKRENGRNIKSPKVV